MKRCFGTLGAALLLLSCTIDDTIARFRETTGGQGGASAGMDGGQGGASPGTGSGGGASAECDDADKLCVHTFTYQASDNTMPVNVRGDFKPDGCTNGVPMTLQGTEWVATVQIPYNKEIHYVFLFLDDQRTVIDWNHPSKDLDGGMDPCDGGGSVLDPIPCDDAICVK